MFCLVSYSCQVFEIVGCNDISLKFKEMVSGSARIKKNKNRGELSTQQTEIGIGDSEICVCWNGGTGHREHAGTAWISYGWTSHLGQISKQLSFKYAKWQ